MPPNVLLADQPRSGTHERSPLGAVTRTQHSSLLLWTSLPDGSTNYFTSEWTTYTGLAPEASQGEEWLEALHPDDRRLCRQQWHAALSNGQPSECDCRLGRASDQQYRWHLWSSAPVRDLNGKIVHWSLCCRDIHESVDVESSGLDLLGCVEASQDIVGLATADGGLLFLNEAGNRHLHRPFFGSTLRDLTAPDDYLTFDAIILPSLQRDGFWQGSFPLRACVEHTDSTPARLHCFLLDNQSRDRRGRPPQTLLFQIQSGKDFSAVFPLASSNSLAVVAHSPRLAAAHRLGLETLANFSGREALHHFAEAARHLTGARYAAIGVGHLVDGSFADIAATGSPTPDNDGGFIKPCPGVLGLMMGQTKPLRLSRRITQISPGSVPRFAGRRSFLGVPIRRGKGTLGCLYLTGREGAGEFTQEDEAVLLALNQYISVAIYFMIVLSRQYALIRGLFVDQEEERRTVAYDLHDGLTQYVMAAHAHLRRFRLNARPRAHPRTKSCRRAYATWAMQSWNLAGW